MAKNASSEGGKVNKSQAVHGFLAEHPKADSKAVIAGLGENLNPKVGRMRMKRASRRPSRRRAASRTGPVRGVRRNAWKMRLTSAFGGRDPDAVRLSPLRRPRFELWAKRGAIETPVERPGVEQVVRIARLCAK
jgi:hypothetical protein